MSSDLAAIRQGMERDRVRQHTKHGRRHAGHGARYRRAEQEYRRNVHQHGQYDETLALDRKQRDPLLLLSHPLQLTRLLPVQGI